jgi:hypothetical protein
MFCVRPVVGKREITFLYAVDAIAWSWRDFELRIVIGTIFAPFEPNKMNTNAKVLCGESHEQCKLQESIASDSSSQNENINLEVS